MSSQGSNSSSSSSSSSFNWIIYEIETHAFF